MARKSKKKYNLNLNKITPNLLNTCNKVLTKREKKCQCFDNNNKRQQKGSGARRTRSLPGPRLVAGAVVRVGSPPPV